MGECDLGYGGERCSSLGTEGGGGVLGVLRGRGGLGMGRLGNEGWVGWAGSVSLGGRSRSACTKAFAFLCEGGIGTWLGGIVNVVDV